MNQEQAYVARAFLEGKAVFAALPTGFGKSLYVLCMPTCSTRYLEERSKERVYSIVIVVITPLIAIMDKPAKVFLHFYRHAH